MIKGWKTMLTIAAAMTVAAGAALAQGKVELIYSDTVPESDIRPKAMREIFKPCVDPMFDFKAYHGATLFKQGTELTALQRGNLDMASPAVSDFYNQVPESSILSIPYLYSSYEHMRKIWDSGVLDGLNKAMEEKTRVKMLTNIYIGTRQLNLRGDRVVMKPADLKGIKLRMPAGEVWQFIGEALGASPTPVAFTETYTALQTGAVDGQDNALPANKSMKFYEVTNQIILTNHIVANNIISISRSKWDRLSGKQQELLQRCMNDYRNAVDKITLDSEAELVDFFKSKGLKVYDADRNAFRAHVLNYYRNSKYAKEWPPGLLEAISKL